MLFVVVWLFVDELLELYPRLPFLLVGDSGQHDPEIYAAATERWKGRILCSYIRDVSADDKRSSAIEELARRCAELALRPSTPMA